MLVDITKRQTLYFIYEGFHVIWELHMLNTMCNNKMS